MCPTEHFEPYIFNLALSPKKSSVKIHAVQCNHISIVLLLVSLKETTDMEFLTVEVYTCQTCPEGTSVVRRLGLPSDGR